VPDAVQLFVSADSDSASTTAATPIYDRLIALSPRSLQ